MSQQQAQTVQVIQRNESCFGGCASFIGFLLLLGLAVAYWYVAVPVAIIAAGVAYYVWDKRRKQLPTPQQGPADPVLNRVAMRLTQHGYIEQTRNTGPSIGGQPVEGDLVLDGNGMRLFVNVLGDEYAAERAAQAMRGTAEVQNAITAGQSAVLSQGRLMFVANPHESGRLNPERLQVAMEIAADEVSPIRTTASEQSKAELSAESEASASEEQTDVLEQLQRLGALRDSGVITEAEFDQKKKELLERL